MRKLLVLNILILLFLGFVVSSQAEEDSKSDDAISCPDRCTQSRKNCELSCSQIVGGGAKAEKRRECKRECAKGLEECNERCVNPTPRPTLKPERYHDKPCEGACEFKAKDCNEICTKYTGGGVKSQKKSVCRKECSKGLEDCKNWCVNPTPRPTLRPNPLSDKPCAEQCKYKKLDCDANCSVYMGGGAKSEKKTKCMFECKDFNDQCLSDCSGFD